MNEQRLLEIESMDHKKWKTIFGSLGFRIIHAPKSSASNGADLWIQKDQGRPMSVEIKLARRLKNGCVRVDPVQKRRRTDDIIAIVCGPKYVLIEPMKDHLKSFGPTGIRPLTILLGRNP